MAERLKVQLLDSDKLVDLVAGPDAYRDIPRLLDTIEVCNLLTILFRLQAMQPQFAPVVQQCQAHSRHAAHSSKQYETAHTLSWQCTIGLKYTSGTAVSLYTH